MGSIQDLSLHFNQKPLLVKSSFTCDVKIQKTQEAPMSSEIDTMLSNRTIGLGPGTKGLFTYPFVIPKKNGMSHSIMNLKPLSQCHYMYKIQDNHSKTDQRGHSPGSLGSLTGHQVSILPHPNSKEALLFSLFQVEKCHIPVVDLLFGLSTAPKIFRGLQDSSHFTVRRWE